MNDLEARRLDLVPMGELKAQHREEHLCLKCNHHHVCKMAAALDPNFLVTISRCLAFEPLDDRGGADA